MGILANCVDPGEMLHEAASHQGLHFRLDINLKARNITKFENSNPCYMAHPSYLYLFLI